MPAVSATINVAGIERYGRPVLADGLLMEWKTENAGKVSEALPFIWDAINTSKGLAGYLIFTDTNRLPSSIILNPVGGSPFRCDPQGGGDAVFGITKEGTSCTVEWVIPADSLRPDARSRYAVALSLVPIGDTSGSVLILLTGPTVSAPSVGATVARAIIVQGSIVVVLGLIYFALLLRTRRNKRKRADISIRP